MIRINFATMQAALACRAGKSEVRYYFNGILIDTAGNVVSTDGAVMCVGTVVGDPPEENMLFRVPLKPPAKYDHVIITENEAMFWTGEQFVTLPLEPIDARFPTWERLVNSFKSDDCVAVGLNGKYLRLIGKIAKPFGDCSLLETGVDNTSMMRWTFQRVEDATTIAEKLYVYLMPCRIGQ